MPPGRSDGRWWLRLCGRPLYAHSRGAVPSTGMWAYRCATTAHGRFESQTPDLKYDPFGQKGLERVRG